MGVGQNNFKKLHIHINQWGKCLKWTQSQFKIQNLLNYILTPSTTWDLHIL